MATETTVRTYFIRTPLADRVALLERNGGEVVSIRTTGMFTYTKRERLIHTTTTPAVHVTFTTEDRA